MKKAIFCLVNTREDADRIVARLLDSNFIADDISFLVSEGPGGKLTEQSPSNRTEKRGHLGTEKHTKAPEGSATGALAGGVIGGSIGLLAGIGSLAIPGLGAFIAAGPLLAALSGSAIGGATGLLLGALIGYGIPEYEAKKYEDGLKKGNVLLCVHARDSDQIESAKKIMKEERAHDISTSAEKTGHRSH